MRLLHIRIIGLLLLIPIVYVRNWTLLPYWLVMILSVEILNRNIKYLSQPFYRFYNLLFMSYLILVVGDRTRFFRLGETIEWSFNSLMHILFGLIVCFKISQYFRVFDFNLDKRITTIALIFNMLGVFNEFLQNLMGSRPMFVLIPDAQKDLAMNGVGTLIFILVEYILSHKKYLS